MRRPQLAAALALVLLALAGCFLDPPNKRAAPVPTELRIGIRQPSTLDPVLRDNPSDLLVARQIFEPLMGFDAQKQALVPKLAASYEVLDGGRRFVFHLRRDASFHNGVSVTATDAAFALNRLARKATNSSLAHLLRPVQGYAEVHGTGAARELSGVRATDAYTLEVTIGEPWYEFPYVLTDPATAPVPAAAFQSGVADFGRHPVGAGPYALRSGGGQAGELVLQRSKNYWGPPPSVATVRFVTAGAPGTILGDLAARRLEIGEVPSDRLEAALASFGGRGLSPLAAGLYLGFNVADRSVADPRLRQAVSLAVDRQVIGRKVYGDVLVTADGFVPSGLPGHTELACATLCTHNPARAKELVAQASPGAAPRVAYDYPTGTINEAVAGLLASDLKAVGIELDLRPRSPEEFLGLLNANTQAMFAWVWVADYPLADWFLTPLFRSGSPDNHAGYKVPEVDSLITQARSAADSTQRLGLYRQVEQRVLADMAMSPIGFFRNHYAATSRVQNFSVDPLGSFEVARLSLGPP